MTRSEIRREEERVARALAYVMRRLEQTFDLSVGSREQPNLIEIEPRCWPDDPKLFNVFIRPELVAALTLAEVRHEALHEILHMMEWPLYEEATKRMNAAQTEAFRVNVWEPHTHELTRRLAPYVLGR